jgi:hypothetical protein
MAMTTTRLRDLSLGLHEGTRALPDGRLTGNGRWTSPVYQPGPFTWAIASWNGSGERIEVEMRAAAPGGWSPWFTFGPWSDRGARHSVEGQTVEGVGRLSTDTLLLAQSARGWQVRVTLQAAELRGLWVATALPGQPAPDTAHREAWGLELDVPMFSQMIYPNGGNVWCSPTSLAMVMAYWGVSESIPDTVVPAVYDSVYDGHGNWVFNTAYAGARGFEAYVDRFRSFAELEREIAAGYPVIASVSYKKEWLPNAPISLTGGHLLVVRGFTNTGDVIVNDPAAASNEGVRLVYQRDLFRRAWLDRAGVVYRIRPLLDTKSA